jgi:hypothetical protein
MSEQHPPTKRLSRLLPAVHNASSSSSLSTAEVSPSANAFGGPLPDHSPLVPKRRRVGVLAACARCRLKKIRVSCYAPPRGVSTIVFEHICPYLGRPNFSSSPPSNNFVSTVRRQQAIMPHVSAKGHLDMPLRPSVDQDPRCWAPFRSNRLARLHDTISGQCCTCSCPGFESGCGYYYNTTRSGRRVRTGLG